jgi:hypothetical protein
MALVPWVRLQRDPARPQRWLCSHCQRWFITGRQHYYKYHYRAQCLASTQPQQQQQQQEQQQQQAFGPPNEQHELEGWEHEELDAASLQFTQFSGLAAEFAKEQLYCTLWPPSQPFWRASGAV